MPSSRLKNWKTMPMWRRRMRASSSSVLPGHLLAREHDLAVVGGVEPGDQVEQRRLAAARRAHDRDELAVAEVEVHAAQGPDRRELGLERLPRPAHRQHRFHQLPPLVGSIMNACDGGVPPLHQLHVQRLASSGGNAERLGGLLAEHRRARRAGRGPGAAAPGSRCRRRPCTRAAPRSRAARPRPRRSTARCRARTARGPRACHVALSADWRSCIATAAATAAAPAWSSCGNGAPNTAITASPTYCITVPPSSRIAVFISARWPFSWPASTVGSVRSAMPE